MAYMSVLSKTDSQLRLVREPTFLSKAILFGFLGGVLGIFLYGSESWFFKLLIGLCALFLSYFLMDNYEICEIDKNLAVVKLIRLHWCQFFLQAFGVDFDHPHVTIRLEDVRDVHVQEQHGTPIGKAYQVVFVLESGIVLGVTEVHTSCSLSEHEEIASEIRSFLNIQNIPKSQDDVDYEGDSSSSSGDDLELGDFEQISEADIKDLEKELGKASQGAESIGDVIPNDNDAAAAAAAAGSSVDDHGDSTCQDCQENAASS